MSLSEKNISTAIYLQFNAELHKYNLYISEKIKRKSIFLYKYYRREI
jgi:hypothetical protein